MKHHALLIGAMTALTFATAAANAQLVSSDFASDNDGWMGIDVQGPPYDVVTRGPYALVYSATKGDPNGCVGTADTAATLFCFSAPSKFLGDRSGYYNGTLRYELRFQNDELPQGYVHPDVILIGGGLTLTADAGADPASQTDTWLPFSLTFNETNWHLDNLNGRTPTAIEFQTTLSNVTALYIRGDFFSGVDTASLDNVVMGSLLPTLQIARANDEVILQWPASAAAFTVQTTQNVADTNSWTTVTNAPTAAGTNLQVTLAPLAECGFFRLKMLQP